MRIVSLRKQVNLKVNGKFLLALAVLYGASTLVFYLGGNWLNGVWFGLMGVFSLLVFRDLLRMIWNKLKEWRRQRTAS